MDIPFNVYCPAWERVFPVLAYRIAPPDVMVTLHIHKCTDEQEYVLCRFFDQIHEHAFYPVLKTFKPENIKSREELKAWLYNQDDIKTSDNFDAWLKAKS